MLLGDGSLECSEKENGVCLIASAYVGAIVEPKESTCRECLSCKSPSSLNYVTASLSVGASKRLNPVITGRLIAEFERSSAFKRGKVCGPGCHLSRILKAAGFSKSSGCWCDDMASIMESRGCDWCRKNLDFIVDGLVSELERRIADGADDTGEPIDFSEKVSWWVKVGHKCGASRIAGKRIVLMAIDWAEAEKAID